MMYFKKREKKSDKKKERNWSNSVQIDTLDIVQRNLPTKCIHSSIGCSIESTSYYSMGNNKYGSFNQEMMTI